MEESKKQEIAKVFDEWTKIQTKIYRLKTKQKELEETLDRLKYKGDIGEYIICWQCNKEFKKSEASSSWNDLCPEHWSD